MENAIAQALPNEQWLVRRAAVEPQVFDTLYRHYFPRIFTYIRYRVDDDATADDLTAFVFERALSRIDQYRPDRAPFSAWLFGIARHAVNNHHRHKRRWLLLPLSSAQEHPAPALQPEEAIERDEAQEKLLRAVSQLSERERDLIALKFVSGLTNRRIAALTGLSESNVSVIVHRSLNRLRAELKEMINHE